MLFQDDTGHQIQLKDHPTRIISLCPSITETLFDLGLANNIIGRTSFCIHPSDNVSMVKSIGGPKKINRELIHSLEPDLIIASKEENIKEDILYLRKKLSVCTFDVKSIEDAIKMIRSLGFLTGKTHTASGYISKIEDHMTSLKNNHLNVKALYLIWKNPWMGAGKDTFISDMLKCAGIKNCLSDNASGYPIIQDDANIEMDYILLSSEPYPFSDQHMEEVINRFGSRKILLVDGEMFSWYGTRMVKAFPYIKSVAEKIKAGQE